MLIRDEGSRCFEGNCDKYDDRRGIKLDLPFSNYTSLTVNYSYLRIIRLTMIINIDLVYSRQPEKQ